jgi:hypothetical protein
MLPLLGFYNAAAALVVDMDMPAHWQADFKSLRFKGAKTCIWVMAWLLVGALYTPIQ